MLFEGTYYIPITINSHYDYSPKHISNKTIVSLSTIIKCDVKVKCYDSNRVVPSSLRIISQDYFSSLTPLNVPIEEHNNIMDEIN